MHVKSGGSGNDSDVVIPSFPSSNSQLADSPCFLMDGLGTKHRVWLQQFGTSMKRATLNLIGIPVAVLDC